jgi:hypothetical protein
MALTHVCYERSAAFLSLFLGYEGGAKTVLNLTRIWKDAIYLEVDVEIPNSNLPRLTPWFDQQPIVRKSFPSTGYCARSPSAEVSYRDLACGNPTRFDGPHVMGWKVTNTIGQTPYSREKNTGH